MSRDRASIGSGLAGQQHHPHDAGRRISDGRTWGGPGCRRACAPAVADGTARGRDRDHRFATAHRCGVDGRASRTAACVWGLSSADHGVRGAAGARPRGGPRVRESGQAVRPTPSDDPRWCWPLHPWPQGGRTHRLSVQLTHYIQGYLHHPAQLVGPVERVGLTLFEIVFLLALIIVGSFLIAVNPTRLVGSVIRLLPEDRRPQAQDVIARVRVAWLGWMTATGVTCSCSAACCFSAWRSSG